jgi:hypothetical protein
MKLCCFHRLNVAVIIVTITILVVHQIGMGLAFVSLHPVSGRVAASMGRNSKLFAEDPIINVEVCGFKDCKRNGGGVRLEKQIKAVSDSSPD